MEKVHHKLDRIYNKLEDQQAAPPEAAQPRNAFAALMMPAPPPQSSKKRDTIHKHAARHAANLTAKGEDGSIVYVPKPFSTVKALWDEMTQMEVLETEHGRNWRAYQGGAKEFERRRRICDAIRARVAAVGEEAALQEFQQRVDTLAQPAGALQGRGRKPTASSGFIRLLDELRAQDPRPAKRLKLDSP